MDAEKRRVLQRLIDAGYVRAMQECAKMFTAPFWWHEDFEPDELRENPRPLTRANGTICFVDTGERILGVTNEHVFQGFVKAISTDPSIICQIGAASFDPRRHLIDCDRTLDLATFNVSEVLVNSSLSHIHRASMWPPSQAQAGTLVILGGWPGNLRDERIGQLDAYFASFITRLDQSSSERIAAALNLAEGIPSGALVLPESPDLGGASGGPVFEIREQPVVSLTLVGFVYEYHRSYEIVFARHASFINADGTLRR